MQHVCERANDRIEQERPQDAGDRGRDRIGQQDERPVDRSRAHHPVGGECQNDGNRQRNHVLRHREPGRRHERLAILAARKQRLEVVEPHEMDGGAERIAQQDGLRQRPQRRDEEEEHQDQHLRQQQQRRQAGAAAEIRPLQSGFPIRPATLGRPRLTGPFRHRTTPGGSFAGRLVLRSGQAGRRSAGASGQIGEVAIGLLAFISPRGPTRCLFRR